MNRYFVSASMFAFPCVLASALVFRLVSAAIPAPCFVVTGTGDTATVYDARTKLTWQQTLDPRSFSSTDFGPYCATLNLNGGGWRAPRVRELLSIVDYSKVNPAIDLTVFPGTPYGTSADKFWTATPDPFPTGGGFVSVAFADGTSDSVGLNHAPWRVRCVR
jgi:hypothetical protein